MMYISSLYGGRFFFAMVTVAHDEFGDTLLPR